MTTNAAYPPISGEQLTIRVLLENQDAALRALENNDLAAYRALAKEEAQLMDELRARWRH